MFEAYVFETPWGWTGLRAGAKGINRVILPQPAESLVWEELALDGISKTPRFNKLQPALASDAVTDVPSLTILREAAQAINHYFQGEKIVFNFTLDLSVLTQFQREVLLVVSEIGYGQVLTYGAVATAVGRSRAARAVGGAMDINQVPLLIPCHRVVGRANLGGFTGHGGLALKSKLLWLEGSIM